MSVSSEQRTSAETEALRELAGFPLVEALYGRRSRRFALGAEIPDGPLAYRSCHDPLPLTELERMLMLSAMGGTTGWHYSITRHARYAPHVSNYAAGAAGRTFPSAAGFHTAELFFTDDSGLYFFPTRDAGALVDAATEEATPELMVERHRDRLRRLSGGRLYLPAEEPYLEGHNTWCVNVPGSLLVIPVADIAQHLIAILCFFVQNGYAIYDDVNDRKIPGLEEFGGLVDTDEPFPLTFTEQYALTEATAELATACYAGVLMLQAIGLGGWMFDGIDRFSMLGASGNPTSPASASATTRTSAGRLPIPPGARGCSRPTARRTTRTWRRPSRPSRSASSVPEGRSTPTPPAPGATAPACAEAPRSTTRSSRPAWRFRPNTSSTPSASSRARCRPSSS
jgi:hypothetical protein